LRLGRGRVRINLALQGGGAHGAFTWGVLDRLLAATDIEFAWISGTSAGAINAVAVASGLAAGSWAAAQESLRGIWEGVERAGVPDLVRMNPLLLGLARAATLPNVSGILSPYEFNPLRFDPLRQVLEKNVDFKAVRGSRAVELLIAATEVATGRARLFRRPEMTVERVLASACLPTLHHAVEIDGRAYWDGGFSANPDLVTLASESPCEDTLIVQLNPLEKAATPRSAGEIAAHVNAITFNQPLLRDIAQIVEAKEVRLGWLAPRGGRHARLRRHRFHLIEAGRYTAGLSADSKVKPDQGMLAYLFKAGQGEAARWIERCRADIGRRSSVDLRARYFSPPSAELPAPPAESVTAKGGPAAA
jgi:NTE family protein